MSAYVTVSVYTESELDAAIVAYNTGAASSIYTINIMSDITLGTDLVAIANGSSVELHINGDGNTIDGAGACAGLQVDDGEAYMYDLTIADTNAIGGNGSSGIAGGGGGGAGLGGGLFVGADGDVDLEDVDFLGDRATGGSGGALGIGSGSGGAASIAGSATAAAGTAGGFGDGGGGSLIGSPGNGGYGGGGGGGAGAGAAGGYGAGSGNALGGGGGAAAGSDIFVQSGGVLELDGGTLEGGVATGGVGSDGAGDGTGDDGIFYQGSAVLYLSSGENNAPLVVDDTVTDDSPATSSSGLLLVILGDVTLDNPDNTYHGGTDIVYGTLAVGVAGAIGLGDYDGANIYLNDYCELGIAPAALVSGTFVPTIYFNASGTIDLQGIGLANDATIGGNGILTVTGGSETVTLDLPDLPSGEVLYARSDLTGGTDLETVPPPAQGTPPNDAADKAIHGPQARATYGVTGAGEKIGIISDSFNALGGAQADEELGYLPGTVTVLGDYFGGADEGRAMAELVHETAPGAQIYFDAGDSSLSEFADAVTALQDAGCNIIVDDISYQNEPWFQQGDTLENAIESFVAGGGNYFTAAGNNGTAYYQATFNPIATALPSVSGTVTAMNFGNGDTLNGFTCFGGPCNIELEWAQPWASIGTGGPNGTGAQYSLSLLVYNSNDQLVASGAADRVGGDAYQYVDFSNLAAGNYEIAIVLNGGTAALGLFRYTFEDNTNPPNVTIDDPNANTGGGNLLGHQGLENINTVGAVNVTETPSQGVSPPVVEPYSSYGPGEILYNNDGTLLPSPEYLGKVNYTAPDGSDTSVSSEFDPFDGTSAAAPVAAATAALMLQANPNLTSAQITEDLAKSAIPMGGADNVGAGLIQATTAVQLAKESLPCFCRGTRISTPHGEVAIEALCVGDRVSLHGGGCAPIIWIGQRQEDASRHPDPESVLPIRIRAGACGPGRPARDLLVSPDHALCLDDILIPARLLLNGDTIVQEPRPHRPHYFHLELERHAVLLAEGMPAESYLDTGNRAALLPADGTAGGTVVLHSDFSRRDRAARSCLPLVTDERVRPIWRRLAGPAATPPAGPDTPAAEPRLRVGGAFLRATVCGNRLHFMLPAPVPSVRLLSNAGRPSDRQPWLDDRRRLGLCATRITLLDHDGDRPLPLDHPGLDDGWWAPERDGVRLFRWTTGDALIPMPPGIAGLTIATAGPAFRPAHLPHPRAAAG